MKRFFFGAILVASLAATASADISYQVQDSFTAVPGLTAGEVFAQIVGSQTDVLTLTFVPIEPGGTVGSPTNTAWGSLYLQDSAPPASTNETFNFSSVTLLLELVDLSTGNFVRETGTFSGTYVASPGDLANTSSGLITWAPQGTQTVPSPSTITFLTDSSDPIGGQLNGGTLTQAATTVNGTVADTSVPEPATLSMLGAGLLGLGMMARRKRKA